LNCAVVLAAALDSRGAQARALGVLVEGIEATSLRIDQQDDFWRAQAAHALELAARLALRLGTISQATELAARAQSLHDTLRSLKSSDWSPLRHAKSMMTLAECFAADSDLDWSAITSAIDAVRIASYSARSDLQSQRGEFVALFVRLGRLQFSTGHSDMRPLSTLSAQNRDVLGPIIDEAFMDMSVAVIVAHVSSFLVAIGGGAAGEVGKIAAKASVEKFRGMLKHDGSLEALRDLEADPTDVAAPHALVMQIRKALVAQPDLADALQRWMADESEANTMQQKVTISGDGNTAIQIRGNGNTVS
jgi:hypothetical protein